MRTLSVLSLATMVLGVHCSGSECSGANCVAIDSGGESSLLDTGSDIVVPQGCDLSKDISASPQCIDDGIGVFVNGAAGDDGNSGTKAKPLKTINGALTRVGGKPRIYVCAGAYGEDVSMNAQNAVSIYGGLACDWTVNGAKPMIGAGHLALQIDGAPKPLVVADVAFVATDATNNGESSIGVLVNASTSVAFQRVRFSAGKGKDGANGTTGSNWSTVAQADPVIAGKSTTNTSGASQNACSLCIDGKNSIGAGGGSGTVTPSSGKDGMPNLGGTTPNDGAGGTSGCVAGHNGAPAPTASKANGAVTLGTLTANGWSPQAGIDAQNGGPGQGGGGGGGSTSVTNGGGGGGGCGGCGGAGGKGGGGGGGSIALVVLSSTVKLVSCQLDAVNAGAGGNGSGGQGGQPGGYAGQGSSPGCSGVNGGMGGTGGPGGGGAGGVSVGVLYMGALPDMDDATLQKTSVASQLAKGGVGGVAGQNDGVTGIAQATFEQK